MCVQHKVCTASSLFIRFVAKILLKMFQINDHPFQNKIGKLFHGELFQIP